MTDDPQNHLPNDGPKAAPETAKPKTIGQTAAAHGKKAVDIVDKASTVAEKTSGVFSAIKWVAIAIVALVIFGGGYAIYKVISVPTKAVGNAVEGMTEAVKSGSGKVAESSEDMVKRLLVPMSDQSAYDEAAERAFSSLSDMAVREPASMKERMSLAANFAGHEGRVCMFDLTVGEAVLPVTLAADNKAHAPSKALGSKNERLIRMVLIAGDKDIALRSEWDAEAQAWILKWKSTTLKKPIEDSVTEQRALEVLTSAASVCE